MKEAGLVDKEGLATRSPHGIRKAAGALLAQNHATQYEIMAIHSHSCPTTSAIYTKGAERSRLAASGTARLKGFAW